LPICYTPSEFTESSSGFAGMAFIDSITEAKSLTTEEKEEEKESA